MTTGPIHILGIESSCDECSASVVKLTGTRSKTLSLATFSQIEIHRPFGGVVPEIASRNHLETINPIIDQAMSASGLTLNDLDAIAVTNRPGLVGALLVGISAGKALSYALNLPLVPVHHLEGHVASAFLENEDIDKFKYPTLVAIISGGHTNLYKVDSAPESWNADLLEKSLVARSRDDAAGEAFDKTAKMLGFPYPGGPSIDLHSKGGDPKRYSLPRALKQKSVLDYSFSGLKTATSLLINAEKKLAAAEKSEFSERIPNLCASIQEAIVDALINKMILAIERHHCKSLIIVGGVSANSRLRQRVNESIQVPVLFPDLRYCTDNAAMIALAGAYRFNQGNFLSQEKMLTVNAMSAAKK